MLCKTFWNILLVLTYVQSYMLLRSYLDVGMSHILVYLECVYSKGCHFFVGILAGRVVLSQMLALPV